MTDQETRFNSLQWLYLTNRLDLPPNKHLIWQCPLLLPENLSDLEELKRRIEQAGNLWLQNHDLRPFNLLIVTHTDANVSYIFQRPQRPGQFGITIGPLPRRLLKKGNLLPPHDLLFTESTKTMNSGCLTEVGERE